MGKWVRAGERAIDHNDFMFCYRRTICPSQMMQIIELSIVEQCTPNCSNVIKYGK